MKNYRLNFSLILIFYISTVSAQELMTLNKAIELALKNNHNIIISKYESQIALNDHSLGNAGFFPQVNVTAGGTISNNNTNQKYSNGQEVNKNNVTSHNLNAGAAMSWTLFDGLKMFATHEKLKILSAQGELNVKINIENTVLSVITGYYELVRIKQLIKEDEESLVIYEEREKITQTKFEIGSVPKSELLQTKIDKNKLKSALLNVKQDLDASKANLNLLLGRPAETNFDISDSMLLKNIYKKEDLINSIYKNNYALQLAEKNTSVSSYSIKEYQSQRLPKIGINAGYNFLRSENKAGFALYNSTYGLNAGFTATWNVFNGFNTNRQIKNARINWLSAKEQYNYTRNAIDVALINAWKRFENAVELLNLEEQNILLAKENVFIALQRYKLGAANILELKEAQRSLEESATRVISARYEACISEAQLMKLNGDLVK